MTRVNRQFEHDTILKGGVGDESASGTPPPKAVDIKCPCCAVKTVAKERGGKIYVWCKGCKSEVAIKSEKNG